MTEIIDELNLIAGRQYAQATLLRALLWTHPNPAAVGEALAIYAEQMIAKLLAANLPDAAGSHMEEELDFYKGILAERLQK